MKNVMDLIVKFIHLFANDFNYCQFVELLEGIEDNEFNGFVLFASTLWLSCRRVLQGFIILLTLKIFLRNKYLTNYQTKEKSWCDLCFLTNITLGREKHFIT